MPDVQTVQGAVDAQELGLVLAHEHVRFRDEAVADAVARAATTSSSSSTRRCVAVDAAKARGVQTIVDPTAMFGGRDVSFMKRVAEETGVRIVACTGIYSYDYLPHYFENRDVDVMADHFVEDIERGIQGTGIRAAFLKCAADAAGVTEHVEKIHRAVARASVQTGAPIMAHSMPAVETGPRQVEIFEEEGVDLSRVQIAHCGDTDDVDYIEAPDRRSGVYVGLDRYGLEMYLPIDKRNATAAELLRRGHAERLMISQDFCASIDWFPPEAAEIFEASGAIRNWSMTLVFDEVVPGAARDGRDGRRRLRDDLPREPGALADGRDRVAPRTRGAADGRPSGGSDAVADVAGCARGSERGIAERRARGGRGSHQPQTRGLRRHGAIGCHTGIRGQCARKLSEPSAGSSWPTASTFCPAAGCCSASHTYCLLAPLSEAAPRVRRSPRVSSRLHSPRSRRPPRTTPTASASRNPRGRRWGCACSSPRPCRTSSRKPRTKITIPISASIT